MSLYLQDRRNYKQALAYGDKRRQHDLATARASVGLPVTQQWWAGRDNTYGTLVSNGGSQTFTETNVNWPRLEVSAISGISNQDLNALMFPASISIGDAWRCEIGLSTSSTDQFLFGVIVMSNGTTTGSTMVGAYQYRNTTGTSALRGGGTNGTFTNFFTGVSDSDIVPDTNPLRFASYLMEIHYTASNTFVARIYGGDGRVFAGARSSSNISQTLTPTHVGIGWSNYGTTPTAPVVTFGPLYKA